MLFVMNWNTHLSRGRTDGLTDVTELKGSGLKVLDSTYENI